MHAITDPAGYNKAKRKSYFLKTRIELSTLAGFAKDDLTDYFMDGAVTVDMTATTTRALDLKLFDPLGKVNIDPQNPGKTSVFIGDMLRVWYEITTPLGVLYSIPVFTGPIDDADRDDVSITIKGLGKEALGLNNSWVGRTYKKGQKKTDVIRSILKDVMGEDVVRVPNKSAKLPNDIKLDHNNAPWVVAKQLAESMNMMLFFDGAGIATLRKKTSNTKFTLNQYNIMDTPAVSYDLTNVVNIVLVKGKKPKKAKKPVQYKLAAPKNHPLSPQSLGRPGAPRYLWQIIEDESLTSVAACKKVAKKALSDGLRVGVEASVDGIPEPRLEEGDMVVISTDNLRVKFAMKKFTIPLTAGTVATYGYLARIKRSVPHKAGQHSKQHKNRNGRTYA